MPQDNSNMLLGNPSGATKDDERPENYLLERRQYALSYNYKTRGPNWVSWHLGAEDLGTTERTNKFVADPDLPRSWRIDADAYKGSGYDRGHQCPSGDRTATREDNLPTFFMSNMLPQAPDLNRGPWEKLESYCRDLVRRDGDELYITAGGGGSLGVIPKRPGPVRIGLNVPGVCWKVVVALPQGDGDLARVSGETRVVAVSLPNDGSVHGQRWADYRVSVDQVERITGYDFLGNVPAALQAAIEAKPDAVRVQ